MEKRFLNMYAYIKDVFLKHEYKDTQYPFRNKLEHTSRVFMWASRILDGENADKDIVLAAAIFHDVGYCISHENHPEYSAAICRKYLEENRFDACFVDKVTDIVINHGNKNLLKENGTSIEQVILIEADCLDETGAMSILRDCMAEGMEIEQSYEKTLKRLQQRSMYKFPDRNPMTTQTARKIWEDKKSFYVNFIDNLTNDLW